MQEKYGERGVQALIIDVLESRETAQAWATSHGFSFPVLHDADGKATELYAPPGVQPALPRNQVPIAANLIIDREGRIRVYTLLDSMNFDAELVALKVVLDEMLEAEAEP